MIRIEYAYATHPGRLRKQNQDNLICGGRYLPRNHDGPEETAAGETALSGRPLFGVFDGMGGEEHGEAASFIAAKTAASADIAGPEDLLRYCAGANRAICEYVREQGIRSSGTTASLLLLTPGKAYVCHIGDSRIYRRDGDQLEQLTKDDVFPSFSGRRHLLLQCLGIPEDEMRIRPHLSEHPLRPGTEYLICTDGLSNMLPDGRTAEALSGPGDLKSRAGLLLELALEAGGRDNITLILARAAE